MRCCWPEDTRRYDRHEAENEGSKEEKRNMIYGDWSGRREHDFLVGESARKPNKQWGGG